MKQIKKLLALVLALAICAAFAIPVMATEDNENGIAKLDGPFTLTMDSPQIGHTYAIYQIFKGDIAEEDGKKLLSNVVYGNSQYGTENESVSSEILDKIAKMASNSTELNQFLNKEVVPYAKTSFKEPIKAEESTQIVWNELPGGYYLVVDETASEDLNGKEDVRSAIMVEMVDSTTIKPKYEIPKPDKKEGIDGAIDADGNPIVDEEPKSENGYKIGDNVPFTVEGIIPVSQLNQYAMLEKDNFYSLAFVDKMTAGLKFNPDSVKIYVKGTPSKEIPVEDYALNENEELTEKDKEAGFTSKFKVSIENLFEVIGTTESEWGPYIQVDENGNKNVVVVLTYTAMVTADAKVSGETKNEATLEFRNDPTDNSEGGGVSPPSEVPVYTFPLDIIKTEGGDTEKPLAGAKFQVKQGDNVLKFVKTETIETNEDGTETTVTTYKYYTIDAFPDLTEDNQSIVTEVETVTDGKIYFEGLDAGTYTLVETEAPNGYNKCGDIEVTIVPGTNDDGSLNGKWTYTINQKDANGEDNTQENVEQINVANNKGTNLPSTGGMGTTIIYIVGAVLVVGAGVLLFTKKRMHG